MACAQLRAASTFCPVPADAKLANVGLQLDLHCKIEYNIKCVVEMDQPAGRKLKFAILVTGNSAPEIEEEFGDYGELYKALLADPDLDEEWHVFYPVNNHFPKDDDLKDFKVRCLHLRPVTNNLALPCSTNKSLSTNVIKYSVEFVKVKTASWNRASS